MQDFDRRFEHLNEFEHALIGQAQAAGVRIRVRIVLCVVFELANIDFTDKRRNVLIVLITRLGFSDRLLMLN